MLRHLLLIPVILVALSCKPKDRTAVAPSREEIWNATYSGTPFGTVTLHDGEWTGEADEGGGHPYAKLLYDHIETGDIDRDGVPEAAVIINENTGGTGQFRHLVLFKRMEGHLVQIGKMFVGDRTQVKSIALEPGILTTEIVRQTGPLCCPDEVVRFKNPYARGQLGEASETVILGMLGPAILSGSSWTPESNISLTYEAGYFRGNAGCNTYSAAVTDFHDHGAFSISPITATLEKCSDSTMKAEVAFLHRLQTSDQMWFSPDHLHFKYTVPGEGGRLDFALRR